MTVTVQSPRFAVEHRPSGTRRWRTVVTVESSAIATTALFDLLAARPAGSGDWRITQLPGVPADLFTGANR